MKMIKDRNTYDMIPFTAKVCIKLLVIIMSYLNKKLKPLNLSPYFCITVRDEEEFPPVIPEKKEEILQ